MKPLFQHIYLKNDESYNVLYVNRLHFVVPWHFHPELEIMLVLEGEGSRIVGDNVGHYTEGDLVMVGSNLPHCWKSGAIHYQQKGAQAKKARAHVILFKQDCWGDNFFNLPEFRHLQQLFKKAERGIRFTGATQRAVALKMATAYALKGARRFALFVQILEDLYESRDGELLASEAYESNNLGADMQRINAVLDFMVRNFHRPVKLDEAAAQAFMSPTSFCRYFKARTNKSFGRLLNELRVGHAKKLLVENNRNVDQICLESGFVNASNFFKQFRVIAGCTPAQYRKQQLEAIQEHHF